jgi:hypothetical protein
LQLRRGNHLRSGAAVDRVLINPAAGQISPLGLVSFRGPGCSSTGKFTATGNMTTRRAGRSSL